MPSFYSRATVVVSMVLAGWIVFLVAAAKPSFLLAGIVFAVLAAGLAAMLVVIGKGTPAAAPGQAALSRT